MNKAVAAFRWSWGLCILPMMALLLLLTACSAEDLERTMSVVATTVAQAPDTTDPGAPAGAASPAASPADDSIQLNWQEYPDLLALPDEAMLLKIQASLAEAVRFQISQQQTGARYKLPLPPELIDMDWVADLLQKQELIAPDVLNWVQEGDPAVLFTLDRPTTYLLPDEGVLFQIVTLNAEPMRLFVEPYLDIAVLESTGQALFVGLIVVHQGLSFEGGIGLDQGVYVVLLRSDGYQLLGISSEQQGEWVLRQRQTQTRQPYTFITYGQICFSGFVRQACLQLTMVGFERTEKLVLAEARRLVAAGLLPNVETLAERINARASFADLTGPETLESCRKNLLEDNGDDDNCSPSLVAAAIDPFFESIESDANPATGEAWPAPLRNAIFGSMLLSVPDNLQGLILNEALQPAILPQDVYRLDLLLLDIEQPIQIGQLTGTQNETRYYVPIVPMEVEGEVIYPAQDNAEIRPNEIVLRSILNGICTREPVSGYEPRCTAPKERTPWCTWINGCD